MAVTMSDFHFDAFSSKKNRRKKKFKEVNLEWRKFGVKFTSGFSEVYDSQSILWKGGGCG